jgi:major membrane immunogen (membrane-anchored lipoprotein)
MKRFIIPSLALAALVTLAACGNIDESRDTTPHGQYRKTDNPSENNYTNPSIRPDNPSPSPN